MDSDPDTFSIYPFHPKMSSLDLSSDPSPYKRHETVIPPNKTDQKAVDHTKFIGVRFNCCGAYTRIYVNKDGTAYEGKCPKCYKPLKVKIGEGGTNNRFFEAF